MNRTRNQTPWIALTAVVPCLVAGRLLGAESAAVDALSAGHGRVVPLVKQYCQDCHSGDLIEGEVDLSGVGSLDAVRSQVKVWQRVAEMVSSRQMPPPEADQPTDKERAEIGQWLHDFLKAEARARAGDPGRVVLRRLNNAEYTYTIRDLTGVDSLDPAKEFPADGGAGEGFTNTGQSLVMSPALVTKYFDAAKAVAGHAVLLPDGFRFSAGDTRRDWTDEALARVREFYGRFTQPLDTAAAAAQKVVKDGITLDVGHDGFLPTEKYLLATLAERDRLAEGGNAIAEVARERGLNPKYLATLWATLSSTLLASDGASAREPSLILDALRARWKTATPGDTAALTASVSGWQNALWKFNNAGAIARRLGRPDGPPSWMEAVTPLVDRQEFRVKLAVPEGQDSITIRLGAGDAGDGRAQDFAVWENPRLVAPGRADLPLRLVRQSRIELEQNAEAVASEGGDVGIDSKLFGRPLEGLPVDAPVDAKDLCVQAPFSIDVTIPAELAAGCELVTAGKVHPQAGDDASVQLQASVGPSADTVSSGLSPSVPVVARKDSAAWKRFEAAFAAFRSLFPKALCYARIVPVDEVVTFNLFYREDDELKRLMLDDAQLKELNRLWNELLFISQEPVELVDVYEQLMGYISQDRSDLMKSFALMREPIEARAAAFRREITDAEPLQLAKLHAFAARAYRRPLRPEETRELNKLYAELRGDELPHEQTFALTLARVLVAPAFLYKAESPGPGAGPQPVSDAELATRLSYFLWSSLPDAELLEVAAAGRLHEPEVLLAQTRRMLHDTKARRLAEEFGTQWLHVHGFAEHDEKSEEVFPTFAALRGAMEEETILFLADFLQNDRSILSLLDADHTFLNEELAKHYAIAGVDGPQWRRVEGVRKQGRGGILGLASTLATQAGASRTSPILRGNWLSEVILGEKLPKPPKNVPLLAETVPEGLTERQLIARHSSDAACAKCHMRIDPFGFALEKYDAIGRFRTQDAAGLPIDAATKLMDGTPIDGPEGLRRYLLEDRRDTFERHFCRKLLGYALGRAVQLSDEPLLDEIQAKLAAEGHRVHVAIEAIVSSPQFRDIRGADAADDGE